MGLNWTDYRQIGALLFEKYDTLNPLTVRFTDMRKWVLDLEDFEGKPEESNEQAPGGDPDGVVRGMEGRVRQVAATVLAERRARSLRPAEKRTPARTDNTCHNLGKCGSMALDAIGLSPLCAFLSVLSVRHVSFFAGKRLKSWLDGCPGRVVRPRRG